MGLIGKVFKLKTIDNLVFLTVDYAIPISQVSGPLDNRLLYRIINFNEASGSLFLKKEGVYDISFEISSSIIRDSLINLDIKEIIIQSNSKNQYTSLPKQILSISSPISSQHDFEFSEVVKCDIREAEFKDGIISFETKLIGTIDPITITINNNSIRSYFDSIKKYIWKFLGKKSIELKVTFLAKNGKIFQKEIEDSILSTISEDIVEQIDEYWIDEVIVNSSSDEILTIDKIVNEINLPGIDENWVLSNLLKEQKTKHYYHLSYLSEKQEIEYTKLSMTGKPLSFIFLVKGNNSFYLIWETYSTKEATYIWKLKTVDFIPIHLQIKEIQSTIHYLRQHNKLEYKKQKVENFHWLEHNYSNLDNGFEEWKNKFEAIVLSI